MNSMLRMNMPPGWESWQLTTLLGEGSYGSVYRAEKVVHGEKLSSAIKLIRIPDSEGQKIELIRETGSRDAAKKLCREMLDSCMQEILALNKLKGITNIVHVDDFAVVEDEDGIGGTFFIRMELLTPFDEYTLQHVLTQEDIIRLGTDIAEALICCEKADIVHRDIKPSNIFRSPLGDYKLGDFGIAKQLNTGKTTGIPRGTLSFMAPESIHDGKYDHRSDLYSLGIVLYKLLNHNYDPFMDTSRSFPSLKDREKSQMRRLNGEPLPPPLEASPRLSAVILKACSYQPKDRYPNAAAFHSGEIGAS